MDPILLSRSNMGGLGALAGVLFYLFRQEREECRKDRQQFGAVADRLADEIKKLSDALSRK